MDDTVKQLQNSVESIDGLRPNSGKKVLGSQGLRPFYLCEAGAYRGIGKIFAGLVTEILAFVFFLPLLIATLVLVPWGLLEMSLARANKPLWAHHWALKHYRRGQYERCLARLEPFIDGELRPATLGLLSLAAYHTGQFERALAYIDRLPDDYRHDRDIQLAEISAGCEVGDYRRILRMLYTFLSTYPDPWTMLAQVGVTPQRIAAMETVLEIFAKAPTYRCSPDPEIIEVRYYLGRCYLEMGEYIKAQMQLSRVHQLVPCYKEVSALLASIPQS